MTASAIIAACFLGYMIETGDDYTIQILLSLILGGITELRKNIGDILILREILKEDL